MNCVPSIWPWKFLMTCRLLPSLPSSLIRDKGRILWEILAFPAWPWLVVGRLSQGMRLDQGFPGYYYSSFSLGVVWELGEELQHLTILENYDFSLTQEVILAPLNPQFQLERLDLKNISYFKNHPELNRDIPSLHGCNIFPSQATYSTRSVTKTTHQYVLNCLHG